MTNCLVKPHKPLDAVVECFWWSSGTHSPGQLSRTLPTGMISLVFNLHSEPVKVSPSRDPLSLKAYSGPVVSGVYQHYYLSQSRRHNRVLGVQFRPGGFTAVTGIEAAQFRDQHVSALDIPLPGLHRLQEELLEQVHVSEAVSRLQSQLLTWLTSRQPALAQDVILDPRFERLCQLPAKVIAEQTGYSERQLNRLYHHYLGLSPKVWARIRRFQHLINNLGVGDADWSHLARQVGYYDQSHLQLEFKRVCGLTPGQYLQNRTARLNHIRQP